MKPRLAASGTLISPVDQVNPYMHSQVKQIGILKPSSVCSEKPEEVEEGESDNQYIPLDPLIDARRGSIKSLRATVFSPPPKLEGRACGDLSHKTIYAIIILLTMCLVVALAVVAVSIFVTKHDSHSPTDSNGTHTTAKAR